MSRSKTSEKVIGLTRSVAVVFGALVLFTLIPFVDHPSRECRDQSQQHETEAPSAVATTASREKDRDGLQQGAESQQEHKSCFAGHDAEQWIAMLTAWLVFGTGCLAVFTALLWIGAEKAGKTQRRQDQEAHRRELRAYVNITAMTVTVQPGGLLNQATAWIKFTNYGKTPAYNLRTYGHFQLVDWSSRDTLTVAREKDPYASRTALGPTAERIRDDRGVFFTWSEIEGREDFPAQKAIMAWGKVVYRDAFGKKHVTWYKAYLGGNHEPAAGVQTQLGTEFRLRTYWNGNDAD